MKRAAPRPKVNKWLVTLSVSFGTLMGAIDISIVNVALPHIRGAVGATIEEITWISTGFVIATVVVMPLTGFLGRMFGQKRVYMSCLALFIAGSVLCGTARSLWTLVFWRAVQGFGAGALQPTEQAILRQTFPAREQGMAMAVFAMAVMLGPAIGPTLGGLIVDNYSWPWIFYINVPIGLLGLFMVHSFVHEDDEIREQNHALAAAQRNNVDYAGIALMLVGLAALQYFLEEGARNDWFADRTITACFFASVVSLAFFVARELTARVPVVNLRLFKDEVFASGTLIGAVMFAMLMVNMFLLPLFMQELLGFTATQSGLALMPRTLVMMVITPFVGKIYNHVSPRLLVGFGIVMVSLGNWYQGHLTLVSSQSQVIGAIAVQGIGFAFLFVPLTTVALSKIPRHLMSDATGLNSLFRQIGGSVGLAIFATLITHHGKLATAAVSAHVAVTNPQTWQRLAGIQAALQAKGYDAASAKAAALQALAGTVQQQGMVLSFEKVFLIAGVVFMAVLPLLWFLRSPAHGGPVEPVHVEM